MRSELRVLRLITFLEGVSYLVLLFVAMPLKYLFAMPIAVRIVGSIHGVLFVSFVLALYRAHRAYRVAPLEALRLFAVSLLPGSLFWLDRRIHELGTTQ